MALQHGLLVGGQKKPAIQLSVRGELASPNWHHTATTRIGDIYGLGQDGNREK